MAIFTFYTFAHTFTLWGGRRETEFKRRKEREKERERAREETRERERVCVCVKVCEKVMGWLRVVGSLKLYVSLENIGLFYRALLQKRPVILRSLLAEAFGNSIFVTLCKRVEWPSSLFTP